MSREKKMKRTSLRCRPKRINDTMIRNEFQLIEINNYLLCWEINRVDHKGHTKPYPQLALFRFLKTLQFAYDIKFFTASVHGK